MKLRYLFFVIFLFVFSKTFAQKPPIKFGEVDISDLEMTVYQKDTSASAVILCNFGYFSSSLMEFTQLLRIKILKKEGYNWANQVFPSKYQYNVKGLTLNLENGKVVKEKLKNESIFNNMVTLGTYETRFTMPNVKVGSVLDMEFTYQGIPVTWRFQETIPVRYSELIIENTPNIRFKSNFFGFEPLTFSSPTRWVAKEMPAFKEEPYINSIENFITKREFDILEIRLGSVSRSYAGTWEDVNAYLLEDKTFRFFYTSSPQVNEIVRRIKETNNTKEEMLKDAFESAKIIKWNEKSSLFTSDQTLNSVIKMKTGNSSDLNSFLYELLKKLDIEVFPVAISTREKGLISQFSPSLNKLNYMIVLAKIGNNAFLLDATEQYAPYYILPLRCLNSKGRIVDATKGDWIDIKTDKKENDVITYDYKIEENFKLTGTLKTVRDGYSALDFRKKYKAFNSSEEFLDDFATNKPGLIINDYNVVNADSIYIPVNEIFNFTIENHVLEAGNELQIIPFLYHQFRENPFKQESRKYPVDFGYGKENTVIASFDVPEGFTVKQLPVPFSLNLNDNSVSFRLECSQSENHIKITSVFTINKPVFLITEYAALRNLFNQMIKKHSEPVILVKK